VAKRGNACVSGFARAKGRSISGTALFPYPTA
jgi:hypothetical protein